MIPATLQIRCEKLVKNITNNIPDNKLLHLLIDVIKLEEYPNQSIRIIKNEKRYIFDYLIFEDEDERDRFFESFHEYKEYYVKSTRVTKLSPSIIAAELKDLGLNVTEERIIRFGNPIKVKLRLDKRANKKDRIYYVNRN